MTRGEFEVSEYADLEGCRLASAGKDRVLQALGEHAAVVWLEEWIRDEKPLDPLPDARSLYGLDAVEVSTDKAWCVSQADQGGPDEVWIPRSCAELYRRAEDGLARENSSQAGLGEWSDLHPG